ncbi:MAG: amidase family protein [Candidatus Binataceae bacterium]
MIRWRSFISRFCFHGLLCALLCVAVGCGGGGGSSNLPFQVDETSIAEVEAAFKTGNLTCHHLVQAYLDKIAAFNHVGPALNPILETNPDALSIADSLDAAFAKSGSVGPLHCVPTILKDNNNSGDRMHTTAGSLTMGDFVASTDAFVVAKLRAAGAVFIAKANMDEWAFGLSGYSSRGGQTLDPYKLDRIPGGSSGGSAVAIAANLGLIATGTDTSGSIRIPGAFNGVVGLKPTLGLVARSGIVPISHYFDVLGPMTRSVADTATMLGVLTGVDPNDPQSAASAGHFFTDYTQFLTRDGFSAARLSVLRSALGAQFSGQNAEVDAAMQRALAVIQHHGGTLVDPVDVSPDISGDDLLDALTVLGSQAFPNDVAQYFSSFAIEAPVQSLTDIVAASEVFGPNVVKNLATLQGILAAPPPDTAMVQAALQTQAALLDAMNAAMDAADIDALVFPTMLCPASTLPGVVDNDYQCASAPPMPFPFNSTFGSDPIVIASITGLPEITVPMGFTSDGLPIALSFLGRAWSEPTLIKFAYAFEQATHDRRPPRFLSGPE